MSRDYPPPTDFLVAGAILLAVGAICVLWLLQLNGCGGAQRPCAASRTGGEPGERCEVVRR